MEPDIWDVILLGRGGAARYYLTTVDRELFPNILVIGLEDSWAKERGYDYSNPKNPVNFINQTSGMLESMDRPEPPFSKELVDRLTFAAQTRKLIDRLATKVVDGEVVDVDVSENEMRVPKTIRATGRMFAYIVTLKNGDEYYSKKVVVATGAGPHQEPVEVRGLTAQHPAIVMDMNTFAQKAGTFVNPEKQTVFIHGPNAAIDTADTAKFQKFNVVWLVKKGTKIPLLATGHQVYAKEAANKDVKEYPDKGRGIAAFTVTVNANDPPLTVTVDGEAIKGHLYVYGMGQDPGRAMKGVIPPKLRDRLVPVYDINQRHGAAHETVLGFKLDNSSWDNGFEVIGAICTQVARKTGGVKHTYLEDLAKTIGDVRHKVLQHVMSLNCNVLTKILFVELAQLAKEDCKVAEYRLTLARDTAVVKYPTWKDQIITLVNLLVNYNVAAKSVADKKTVSDGDLNRVTEILTPSTVAHAQLGAIRTSTAAMNGFARADPNLSQDDQTILRFSIAVNYPFVSENDARAIMRDIIAGRRSKEFGGYCYNEGQKQTFRQRLEEANARGYKAVTQPKIIGTGRTQAKKWVMKTETQVFV